MGKGLVEIEPPQGMSADMASASVILASSQLGFALSTTHVATGSILGSGLGRRGADVRWSVALRMVLAWFITLPAAGLVGAVCFFVGNGIGGYPGVLVVFGALVGLTGWMIRHSRKTAVHAGNVNEDWHPDATPGASVPAPTTSAPTTSVQA